MVVILRGGGAKNLVANPTILSGDIGTVNSNTDNSYHVLVIAGLTNSADSVVLDGLTIMNGNANAAATRHITAIPFIKTPELVSI